MNLIQIQNGNKAYGSRSLFESATFAINEGEHVGVIGPNGAGKTTLFRILNGEEELDSGQVVRSGKLRIGYLEQEVVWADDVTLEDYLQNCRIPLWDLKNLGRGLGLDEEKFHVSLNSLSGGFRMRCKLLYLIGQDPNLMMLDEPTNYLDLETLLVLERFLQDYQGAFMLISHDREFLRRTTDHTLEIESQEIRKFPGNIDDYFEQKALLREQLEKQATSQAAKRQVVLDFAARFGAKASKARQAQSRLKSLARMEQIEVKPLPVTARIRIPEPGRIGKKALSLQNVDLGYGDNTILSKINLHLIRGDKVGVVGFNGVGKSTLLKGLASTLSPQKGEIEFGLDVRVGYYAQHVAEELDPSCTVQEELQRSSPIETTPQEILDLAGSLLFSGEEVEKPVAKLSGGEKARLALGKILLMKVPVLLLDEVTNHLDFNTVEALTQALKRYQGTLVLVSHDRGFIGRIVTKILEIRDGRVLEYLGTYDEYVWSLEKGVAGELLETPPAPRPTKNRAPNPRNMSRENKKMLERDIRALDKKSRTHENRLTQLQKQIEDLNGRIASGREAELAPLLAEIGKLSHELVATEEAWLRAQEERDAKKAQLEFYREK